MQRTQRRNCCGSSLAAPARSYCTAVKSLFNNLGVKAAVIELDNLGASTTHCSKHRGATRSLPCGCSRSKLAGQPLSVCAPAFAALACCVRHRAVGLRHASAARQPNAACVLLRYVCIGCAGQHNASVPLTCARACSAQPTVRTSRTRWLSSRTSAQCPTSSSVRNCSRSMLLISVAADGRRGMHRRQAYRRQRCDAGTLQGGHAGAAPQGGGRRVMTCVILVAG